MELKASIPYVHANSQRLYDILHLDAFPADSIQLKKPSVARRAYRLPSPRGLCNLWFQFFFIK
jgi:hypothetical protein